MGKTHRHDNKGKAKRIARARGQGTRDYGKAGAHEDSKSRRDDRKSCRKKVDIDDYEEEIEDKD